MVLNVVNEPTQVFLKAIIVIIIIIKVAFLSLSLWQNALNGQLNVVEARVFGNPAGLKLCQS